MSALERRIAENLAEVRGRIAEAAHRAGRAPQSVTLVAVTKYTSTAAARALVAAGCHELGESRPQELWAKAEALVDQPVRWHLIGHLQRNKIRRTLPLVHLVQSVDSQRLLEAIDAEAATLRRSVDVLVEINISSEQAKTGLAPDALEPLLESVGDLRHVSIRGLMGMAGQEGDLAQARREFAHLRELRDRAAARYPALGGLSELSMGMSGDFELAIAEGATIVRVGSALFEGIDA
jgi:pyridoxal phosphate enzyme (YggS family)